MNAMRDKIRQSSQVDVGLYNTTANTFSLIGIGTNQIGNALQINCPRIPASPILASFIS